MQRAPERGEPAATPADESQSTLIRWTPPTITGCSTFCSSSSATRSSAPSNHRQIVGTHATNEGRWVARGRAALDAFLGMLLEIVGDDWSCMVV